MDKLVENNNRKSGNLVNYVNVLEKTTKNSSDLIEMIEDLRRKNVDQFGDSPQQKVPKYEDFEKLRESIKQLEKENYELMSKLESTRTEAKDLGDKLKACNKEVEEFKRINTIQENCIENSESEILRLNQCLMRTEVILQETVEVSEVRTTSFYQKSVLIN